MSTAVSPGSERGCFQNRLWHEGTDKCILHRNEASRPAVAHVQVLRIMRMEEDNCVERVDPETCRLCYLRRRSELLGTVTCPPSLCSEVASEDADHSP